jgi:RNA polymerase sigma-70 factor (ECF subfamily)
MVLEALLAHRKSFQGFVRKYVKDAALAEDLVQGSLMRAVMHRQAIREESVISWFYQVLRNAITDHYRSLAAQDRMNQGFRGIKSLEDESAPPLDEIKDAVCGCMARLLPTLRESYAEVIRRVDFEEEAPKTVAESLGISINNINVRLVRARKALRHMLEQSCGVCATHGACLNCSCEESSPAANNSSKKKEF